MKITKDFTQALAQLITLSDKYTGKVVDLEIKTHREKRSLNANSYFHVLATKIAQASNTSMTRVKNVLLADYGQLEYIDGELVTVIMKDCIDVNNIEYLHLKSTTSTQEFKGVLYRTYLSIRGSHTYNTKEMARLIEGTVTEAKEMGIETLTPNEIQRMLASWKGGTNEKTT